MKDRKHLRILRLTSLALLLGLELLLALTPIGYLKIGGTSATLLTLPIAVAAVALGPAESGILGLAFGITSFVQCFFGDPLGTLAVSISPWRAAVMCILPRLVMGIAVGWIFRWLTRANCNKTVTCAVTCGCAPLLNTILFIESLVILYGSEPEVLALFKVSNLWGIVLALISLNAVLELALCLIVGTPLTRIIARKDLLHRTNNHTGENENENAD